MGCASTGPNVRALRMYEHEQPTVELLNQHLDQLARTLELIAVLVNGTPYQPGAAWVRDLPLDEAKALRARNGILDAAGKASFVNVYITHVDSLLADLRRQAAAAQRTLPAVPTGPGLPPPAVVPVPGYASIHDALAYVHPALVGESAELERQLVAAEDEAKRQQAALEATGEPDPNELARSQATQARLSAELVQLRGKLSRPVSASDLQDPTNAQIVKDALTVTSVAVRLATEALALATVAALEAASLAQQSPRNWLTGATDTAELIADLPPKGRSICRDLEASQQGLRALLAKLALLVNIDPLETAGYRFKEGLLDEVVGLAADSVHVDVHAGGEALFYAALADEELSTDDKGNTYDYTGRLTKLEYDVEPIVLASAQVSLKFDWAHWADAVGLKLGYATNRVYKSGGDLGSGSLAGELGVKGAWSEALDAALAVAGVRAGVRLAHFTHGVVRDTLVADGSLLADAPLTFEMKQIDIGYDLAPRRGPVLQSLAIGFRYFDYELPRILYELVNVTPGADTAAYVFSRETPPQAIRTRYYMLDIAARAEKPLNAHFIPYLSLDLAAGYGPSSYYFLRDPDGDDVESNREHTSSSGFGANVAGMLGFRWQFGGPEARLKAFFDAYYRAQAIWSIVDSKNQGDTIVNVGVTDLFHGPYGAFGLSF